LLGIPDASNRIADTPVTATAFGTVLDGIDTAKTISKAGRDDAQPAQEYTIVSITIAEDPKR
jgi:cyclophilin family peptidyl-prolyl cis-trans isomerase